MKTKKLKKKQKHEHTGEPIEGEANGSANGIHPVGDVKAKKHKIDSAEFDEE